MSLKPNRIGEGDKSKVFLNFLRDPLFLFIRNNGLEEGALGRQNLWGERFFFSIFS